MLKFPKMPGAPMLTRILHDPHYKDTKGKDPNFLEKETTPDPGKKHLINSYNAGPHIVAQMFAQACSCSFSIFARRKFRQTPIFMDDSTGFSMSQLLGSCVYRIPYSYVQPLGYLSACLSLAPPLFPSKEEAPQRCTDVQNGACEVQRRRSVRSRRGYQGVVLTLPGAVG